MKKPEQRFIEFANRASQLSNDTNCKVGAVIVSNSGKIISWGYNDFPSNVEEKPERREKPLKYLYTEHAERNAISNAMFQGDKVHFANIYVTRFCCADCARAIISSGIKRVFCPKPDLTHPTWGDHFRAALNMFHETRIEVIYTD